ncbi:MAG: hypothetical protein HN429_01155 [Candidatus Magasanikbacteria bacterium]|nr:hypothetical protein [Candidatus Magasanikbacteria bacterium]
MKTAYKNVLWSMCFILIIGVFGISLPTNTVQAISCSDKIEKELTDDGRRNEYARIVITRHDDTTFKSGKAPDTLPILDSYEPKSPFIADFCIPVDETTVNVDFATLMENSGGVIKEFWGDSDLYAEAVGCSGISWPNFIDGDKKVKVSNFDVISKTNTQRCNRRIARGVPGLVELKARRRYFTELPNTDVYIYYMGRQAGGTGGGVGTPAKKIDKQAIKDYYASRYDAPENALLPECAYKGNCEDVNDLLEVLLNIAEFIFRIIGTVAFVLFIAGGFVMITSFGNAEKFKKGRDILIAATVGLIIAFSAFFLVRELLDVLGVANEFRGL